MTLMGGPSATTRINPIMNKRSKTKYDESNSLINGPPVEEGSISSSSMVPLKIETSSSSSSFRKTKSSHHRRSHKRKNENRFIKLSNENDCFLLESDALQVRNLLGKGSFCTVHEVTLLRSVTEDLLVDEVYALKQLKQKYRAPSATAPPSRHSLRRQMSTSSASSAASTTTRIKDLIREANLLSSLSQNKHIISLHAVVQDYDGGTSGLLLDKLHSTLDERLLQWKSNKCDPRHQKPDQQSFSTRIKDKYNNIANNFNPSSSLSSTSSLSTPLETMSTGRFSPPKSCGGMFSLVFDRKQRMAATTALREYRIQAVAIPIATAFQHLHEHNIVFRDLKPDNVGFDQYDCVKVFDFGLAKHISKSGRRLTGFVGSLRYMAPEVAEHLHYGFPADVYSFTLLLWELLTLQKPFEGMSPSDISEHVVRGKLRPKINRSICCGSMAFQRMIQAGWQGNPDVRPTMTTFKSLLQDEIAAPSANSETGSRTSRLFSFGSKQNATTTTRGLRFRKRNSVPASGLV